MALDHGPKQSLSGMRNCLAALYAMADDFCKSFASPERQPAPLPWTWTATPNLSFILRKLSFSGDLWYNRPAPLGLIDARGPGAPGTAHRQYTTATWTDLAFRQLNGQGVKAGQGWRDRKGFVQQSYHSW